MENNNFQKTALMKPPILIINSNFSIRKQKEEIVINLITDFERKTSETYRYKPDEIKSITILRDGSITRGAIKLLKEAEILFVSHNEPIIALMPIGSSTKSFRLNKAMAELKNSEKRKLAYAFCKGVCLGRIYELRKLNVYYKIDKIKGNIKSMQLNERKLRRAKNTNEMKAYEGNIAEQFYLGLSELLPDFDGKRGRDKEDLFNALLNYTHGLLRAKIKRKIAERGINTMFGFLHFQKDHYEDFLVWDFAEFFIPRIDIISYYIISKGIIKDSSLKKAQNNHGIWLNENAHKKVVEIMSQRFDDSLIDRKIDGLEDFLLNRKRFSWTI